MWLRCFVKVSCARRASTNDIAALLEQRGDLHDGSEEGPASNERIDLELRLLLQRH